MPRRATLPALLALLAIAGCARFQPTPATHASAGAVASCRQSTDAAFNRQNRYLLSERSETGTPFSTSGTDGITTRGLTQQYDYDTALHSCLTTGNADGAESLPAGSVAPSNPP